MEIHSFRLFRFTALPSILSDYDDFDSPETEDEILSMPIFSEDDMEDVDEDFIIDDFIENLQYPHDTLFQDYTELVELMSVYKDRNYWWSKAGWLHDTLYDVDIEAYLDDLSFYSLYFECAENFSGTFLEEGDSEGHLEDCLSPGEVYEGARR